MLILPAESLKSENSISQLVGNKDSSHNVDSYYRVGGVDIKAQNEMGMGYANISHNRQEQINDLYMDVDDEMKALLHSSNLLFCAEKVADNQYERALKFLKECDKTSFSTGTPIQRLVFYFSRGLFEKIAYETGRIIVNKKHADADANAD